MSETGIGCKHVCLGNIDTACLPRDDAAFVADLALKGDLIRPRAGQGVCVRTVVNVEQRGACLHELIVCDIEMGDRAVDQWGHANEIGKDFSIVSTWVYVHLVNHQERDNCGACHDPDADGAANDVKTAMLHGSSFDQLKKMSQRMLAKSSARHG